MLRSAINRDQLSIASRIEAIIEEILSQTAELKVKTPKDRESPKLLALLTMLADVVGEEVVVNAVSICQADGVAILMTEQDYDVLQNCSTAPGVSSSQEDVFHNEEEDEDFVQIDLDSDGSTELANETISHSFEQRLRKTSITSSSEGSDDVFIETTSAKGNEESQQEEQTSDYLRFYEISYSVSSQNTLFLLPDVNYCTCERFQKTVLQEEKEFSCSHVMAMRLAPVLTTVRHVKTSSDTMRVICKQLVSMAAEFR